MAKQVQVDDADAACLRRAKSRGQRTFTLVEQDASSPVVIAEWIKQNIETAPGPKLMHALETAIFMRTRPSKHAD